jgi:hypothetical protein
MALAFQKDLVFPGDDKGVRTRFFDSLGESFERIGWFESFTDEASDVFLRGSSAVLVADTAEIGKPLLLWFVDEGGRELRGGRSTS